MATRSDAGRGGSYIRKSKADTPQLVHRTREAQPTPAPATPAAAADALPADPTETTKPASAANRKGK